MQRQELRTMVVDWLDDNYLFGDADELITSDDMSFLDNGVLDSLGFVQLILFLEDSLGIQLDRKRIKRENFDGMNKILQHTLKHLN